MKPLFNRFPIAGVSVLFFTLCHNTVVDKADAQSQAKLLSAPSEGYFPQTPQSVMGYIWPTYGIVTSGFGQRLSGKIHTGIDIAGPIGTPIVAAASGVVVFAGWSTEGYGNLVTIRHPDGSLSLYGHNDRILVRQGQQVELGQQIAQMGTTGNSSGPHLHFEIHPQGRVATNPRAFLPTNQPPVSLSRF